MDLLLAVRSGNLKKVKKLLLNSSDEDLIKQDKFGNTPLHCACSNGHLEIVRELLPRLKDKYLTIENNEGNTPLHNACILGHLAIVKELLAKFKYEDVVMLHKSHVNPTPLHYAFTYKHLKIVKKLLSILKDVDLIVMGMDGFTLMDFANMHGNLELIKLFILSGIPVHRDYMNKKRDKERKTYMNLIKWSKHEHKNIMHIQTRKNMQFIFMVYGIDMLEKL